eukprot:403344904
MIESKMHQKEENNKSSSRSPDKSFMKPKLLDKESQNLYYYEKQIMNLQSQILAFQDAMEFIDKDQTLLKLQHRSVQIDELIKQQEQEKQMRMRQMQKNASLLVRQNQDYKTYEQHQGILEKQMKEIFKKGQELEGLNLRIIKIETNIDKMQQQHLENIEKIEEKQTTANYYTDLASCYSQQDQPELQLEISKRREKLLKEAQFQETQIKIKMITEKGNKTVQKQLRQFIDKKYKNQMELTKQQKRYELTRDKIKEQIQLIKELEQHLPLAFKIKFNSSKQSTRKRQAEENQDFHGDYDNLMDSREFAQSFNLKEGMSPRLNLPQSPINMKGDSGFMDIMDMKISMRKNIPVSPLNGGLGFSNSQPKQKLSGLTPYSRSNNFTNLFSKSFSIWSIITSSQSKKWQQQYLLTKLGLIKQQSIDTGGIHSHSQSPNSRRNQPIENMSQGNFASMIEIQGQNQQQPMIDDVEKSYDVVNDYLNDLKKKQAQHQYQNTNNQEEIKNETANIGGDDDQDDIMSLYKILSNQKQPNLSFQQDFANHNNHSNLNNRNQIKNSSQNLNNGDQNEKTHEIQQNFETMNTHRQQKEKKRRLDEEEETKMRNFKINQIYFKNMRIQGKSNQQDVNSQGFERDQENNSQQIYMQKQFPMTEQEQQLFEKMKNHSFKHASSSASNPTPNLNYNNTSNQNHHHQQFNQNQNQTYTNFNNLNKLSNSNPQNKQQFGDEFDITGGLWGIELMSVGRLINMAEMTMNINFRQQSLL